MHCLINNKEEPNNPYKLKNTTAFGQFNGVSTSFHAGLEKSIMEMTESAGKLLMSEVLDKFGDYPSVHQQVRTMILENKLVLYELKQDSFITKSFDQQELQISKPELSQWVDLSAQPCLTCPIFNECDINNPVSPASCEEFEAWLQEEISLELGYKE